MTVHMLRHPLLIAVSAALLASPTNAQVRGVSAAFGVSRSWSVSADPGSAVALLPSLAFDRGRWRAEGNVARELSSTGVPGTRIDLGGLALGPRLGAFHTEIAGDYHTPAKGDPAAELRASARIHWSSAARGLWAGLGHARVGAAGTVLASGGAWWSGRQGTLSLRLDDAVGGARYETETFSDTLVVLRGLPSIRTRSAVARFVSANGRGEWSVGLLNVEAPGAHHRQRAGADGSWWVTPSLALVGGYGVSTAGAGVGGRAAARFGLLLRRRTSVPRPSTLIERATAEFSPLGHGVWRVRIPAPGAGRVEIQGSSTAWEPVALSRGPNGWWEGTLWLPPGRHEFTWRHDAAEWQALPGLPSASDPLLGEVTVVVAEE